MSNVKEFWQDNNPNKNIADRELIDLAAMLGYDLKMSPTIFELVEWLYRKTGVCVEYRLAGTKFKWWITVRTRPINFANEGYYTLQECLRAGLWEAMSTDRYIKQ